MARIHLNALIFMLISSVLSETPMYSENYAKIRYQPRANWRSHKAELNLDERHREEVTEKVSTTNADYADNYDVTTESESEQINLERFIYKNKIKDKLVENNENDKGATDVPQEDQIIKNNVSNETMYKENINTNKEDMVVLENENFLGDLDHSEVSNLNQQGVYHIYHPTMLLRKAVYRTHEGSDESAVLTHIKFENVAPIVEPFYSYNPRTFVLQRLILRPQVQT